MAKAKMMPKNPQTQSPAEQAFHAQRPLTKKEVAKIRPGTWIEVKYLDVANTAVLVLDRMERGPGEQSLRVYDPSSLDGFGHVHSHVVNTQVVRVLGEVEVSLTRGQQDVKSVKEILDREWLLRGHMNAAEADGWMLDVQQVGERAALRVLKLEEPKTRNGRYIQPLESDAEAALLVVKGKGDHYKAAANLLVEFDEKEWARMCEAARAADGIDVEGAGDTTFALAP